MRSFEKLQRKLLFRKLNKAAAYDKVEPGRQNVDDRQPFLFTFQGEEPDTALEQMDSISDALFASFNPSDRIFIKINTNSSLPYPASTSARFLQGFLTLLNRWGFVHLTVGDCSSNRYLPTKNVFKKLRLDRVIRGQADMVFFEEEPYVEVNLGGEFLKTVRLSTHAFNFDKIINLTNMKTHCHADYSLAMKNLVGFVHPLDRRMLHESRLSEKIAELSLGICPDLNIIDARRFFITGGPDEGCVATGNTVLVGNDLLKIDLAAYRMLYKWKRDAGLIEDFQAEPSEMAQIHHYLKIHGRANN